MVDSKQYSKWFEMAKKDFQSAQILYKYEADYGIACFHCQQAVEKYLKGYLIFKTGRLFEGHNLVKLCKRAMQFDDKFKVYLKDCAFINTFYIETRYPAEDPLLVSSEDVEECFKIVKCIIAKVDELLAKI